MKKFAWQASDSAPRNYPMEIVAGGLIYDGGSLYVPDKSPIHGEWGRGFSSHIVGEERKPLPRQLSITFFSYTENQFYEGKFDLPYERILKLFQDGYYSPNEEKHTTYDMIVVGVAPGGVVSVWLAGINRTTEVFFGVADKVSGKWSSILDNPRYTRDEHVRLVIEDSLKTPEALAALRRDGVPLGRWESYRTRYAWQPLFTNMSIRDGRIIVIKYFNGELDYLNYPMEQKVAANTRAVPSYMNFIWEMTPIKGRSIELTFKEVEILDAFKKLGSSNQPLQLEMRLAVINNKYDLTIWLRNDQDAIELKGTDIKVYAVQDRKVEGAR